MGGREVGGGGREGKKLKKWEKRKK